MILDPIHDPTMQTYLKLSRHAKNMQEKLCNWKTKQLENYILQNE